MSNIWFISDTHFFHDNILKFKGDDDKLIRPGFKDVDEMNWFMVEKWNSVVKSGDKVWHLGDVAFKTEEKAEELQHLLSKLNGHKRMLLGNHDNSKSKALQNSFYKIEYWKGFHNALEEQSFTATHVPHRLSSLRDGNVNVHGHIHQNKMDEPGYINVSVEVRDYTPVHLDQILKEVSIEYRKLNR